MTDLFNPDIQPIKAFTVWQPQASLFSAGVKLRHTPDWQTPYRGPIAVHGANRINVPGAPEALCRSALGHRWRYMVPLGMVMAVGELTGCYQAHRLTKLTRADREAGDFYDDRYAWRIENLRPLIQPIPARGRQGLWNWEPPRPLDFASLTALCDVFFPRIWLRRARQTPLGTVSLSVYFHVDAAGLSRAADGYLFAQARGQGFGGGYFDHGGQLWSAAGDLLATTHQVMYYKE